jgi:adenine-specific DNA-methyltransferase
MNEASLSSLTRLQAFLRDLFQLDLADLDFGLYRLLRLRGQEVEAFLTEQLPRRVEEAFETMTGEERGVLEKNVAEIAELIGKEVAADALLESGRRGEARMKAEGLFDEALINGDTATPGVRSLDGLFKRLIKEGAG